MGNLSTYEQQIAQVGNIITSVGGKLVTFPYGQKKLEGSSWPRRVVDSVNKILPLKEKLNLAVVFGEVLIDLEVDHPLALKTREYANLPEPGIVWGRKSSPGSHYLYLANGFKYHKIVTPQFFNESDPKAMLIEIRTGNHYSVIPPSRHPSGEDYEFLRLGELTPIPENFRTLVDRWGAQTIMAKLWPMMRGNRNNLAGAFAGFLRKHKWTEYDILLFMQGVLICGEDEEWKQNLEYVKRTVERVDQGGETTGETDIKELIDEPTWRTIRKLLHIQEQYTFLSFALTDYGNAERLLIAHEADIRFCEEENQWYIWTGKYWKKDTTSRIYEFAVDTIKNFGKETLDNSGTPEGKKALAWAVKSLNYRFIEAMIKSAEREFPEIKVNLDDLDANPYLLNCQNGTVNLKTGDLYEWRREDLITKITKVNYSPGSTGPVSERFLQQLFHGSQELIDYVLTLFGLSIIGEQTEHVLPIFWGTGSNGKSTLLALVDDILGDYGKKASQQLFISQRDKGASPELLDLRGVRFTYTSEGLDENKIAEDRIKSLTGGDMITARALYGKYYVQFSPSHTIFLAANNKPNIQGQNEGIWRRVKLIPFTARFIHDPVTDMDYKIDVNIGKKLQKEQEWWLAQFVLKAIQVQKDGLHDIHEVVEETTRYQNESDFLGEWLQENCKIGHDEKVEYKYVWENYRMWCIGNDEKPVRKLTFGKMLADRGFDRRNHTGNKIFVFGLSLAEKSERELLPGVQNFSEL